jgi:predicted aspartyl protease
MSRNPIGSLVSEFTINGVREQWLLDTGANYSVVTRSFAERLGVTPLAGSAMVGSGLTGLKSPLQAAILPQLQLGGGVEQRLPGDS